MRCAAIAALVLLSAGAHAAERPADFAFGAPVRIDGKSAVYSFAIPPAVYAGTVRADLGDLRVFNAAGEAVPFAFVPRTAGAVAAPAPVRVPLFPLRAPAGAGLEGMDVRVERAADGTIVSIASRPPGAGEPDRVAGYIVDASALKEPVAALELELAGAGDVLARVRVEAGDDLAVWQVLAADAPVVRLTADGERLAATRIAFAPRRAKYLRLSWPPKGPAVELAGVRAEAGATRVEPARLWSGAAATPVQGAAHVFDFDLGGRFPADRLRVVLPEPNTVLHARFFTRARPDAEWRPVAAAVLYRFVENGHEVANPDVVLHSPGERYWQMRVDPRSGAVTAPRLELGWVPQAIAFAARGADPFLVAWGNRDARPASLAIETLVPGYRRGEGGEAAVTIARASVGEPAPIAGTAALAPRTDWKRVVLWASLVAGVVLLGAMAWRLARKIAPPGSGGSPSG
ncbi:MAG: DUF3999 domain-containing protein [Burkholderiales bacterium]|nr:DUF3999 domain-containing protein [Burkholderiales bacterium]